MTRRFLISSLAVGLLALGGLNAQAGQISISPVGAPLSDFVTPPAPLGNYAIVGNLEFSDFTYTPQAVSPPGPAPPPTAANVTVAPFTYPPAPPPPGETGISFTGGFYAAPDTIVDYKIGYTVTALSGTITDAYMLLAGGPFGGNGSVSAAETITNAANGAFLGSMEGTFGALVTSTNWSPGVTSISVAKDMLLVGGSNGATVSFVGQAFSSAIPEPASMALLGIGLSGLFTLRRLFKRTSVA